MDEFREVVSVWKPKIVGITESCSKDKSEGDTHLEGYSKHRDDRGRGVILYIDNKLQSTPCVELNSTDFESCVWNIITLNKKDKLLVGCIYKSTSSTEYNTNLLIEMLKKAVEKHGISHLLIFGDFNFPEIDWINYLIKGSDISLPAIFFDITQDLFLKQHVDFNTRFREGNESSMLDLIFTNEDYMIENLRSIAPLGKSDHVGLLFTFITYSAIDSRVYGGKKYDYWKAAMSEINSSLQKVKWEEEMVNKGVNQSWRFFKSKIEEVVKNNVPLKERRKQRSKPPWQTKRVCRSVKKQTQLWKRYERTGRNKEYENIRSKEIRTTR